jgi:hypothetical protein
MIILNNESFFLKCKASETCEGTSLNTIKGVLIPLAEAIFFVLKIFVEMSCLPQLRYHQSEDQISVVVIRKYSNVHRNKTKET